jgi:hypothetical protein
MPREADNDLSRQLQRLTALAKRLKAETDGSADARRTLEAVRRKIAALRQALKAQHRP